MEEIGEKQDEFRLLVDQRLEELEDEMTRVQAELSDISRKLEQSRGEVERLSERNTTIVGEVRRLEQVIDQTPRLTIVETYQAALDVLQRLLTIRGEVEKLKAEEAALGHHVDILRKAKDVLDQVRRKLGEGDGPSGQTKAMIVHIIDAQEEERERLARSMHDGPAHSLTNFILQAEICQRLFDRDPEQAKAELVKLKEAANAAFKRVRSFIFDLRPMMLTDLGLVPTVRRYLDAFQEKTGIEVEFALSGRDRRLENYREVLVFRGLQELLTNARDHGGATSVTVSLDMGEDMVRAIVEDNGAGYGTGQLDLEVSNSKALGLSTLQQRLRLVGGSLHIDRVVGRGARIEMSIPSGSEVNEVRDGIGAEDI